MRLCASLHVWGGAECACVCTRIVLVFAEPKILTTHVIYRACVHVVLALADGSNAWTLLKDEGGKKYWLPSDCVMLSLPKRAISSSSEVKQQQQQQQPPPPTRQQAAAAWCTALAQAAVASAAFSPQEIQEPQDIESPAHQHNTSFSASPANRPPSLINASPTPNTAVTPRTSNGPFERAQHPTGETMPPASGVTELGDLRTARWLLMFVKKPIADPHVYRCTRPGVSAHTYFEIQSERARARGRERESESERARERATARVRESERARERDLIGVIETCTFIHAGS